MPTLIIIAGPNGAGKTTFAREYLAADERSFEFVNADEIARGLPDASELLAARIMLTRIDELIEARADFAIETTLANLTYARKILIWRAAGYRVRLIYLRLGSAEVSIARVLKRVSSGGHDIPKTILLRRFERSENCFETVYKPLVDEWYDLSNRHGRYELLSSRGINESEA